MVRCIRCDLLVHSLSTTRRCHYCVAEEAGIRIHAPLTRETLLAHQPKVVEDVTAITRTVDPWDLELINAEPIAGGGYPGMRFPSRGVTLRSAV